MVAEVHCQGGRAPPGAETNKAMDIDVLRPRVDSIAIEVTSRCNLRCSYCHKADAVFEALPASNMDMTDEMIRGLYASCKEAGIRHVALAVGGETTFATNWEQRIADFLDD